MSYLLEDNYIIKGDETDKLLTALNRQLKERCPNFALDLNYVTTKTMELSLKLITKDEPIVVSQITMFNVPPDMIYINFYTEDEYQRNSFISYLIAVLVLIGDTIQFQKPTTDMLFPAKRIGLTDVTRDKISGHEMNKYIVSGGTKEIERKRKKSSSGSSGSSSSRSSSSSSSSRSSSSNSNTFEFPINDRTIQIAQEVINKFFEERDVDTCLLSPKIKEEKVEKRAAARTTKAARIGAAYGGKGKNKSYKKTRKSIRKCKSTHKRKRRTYRKSSH
jgi:hypothetical protein